MAKVLVTGANGLLGSQVLRDLVQSGHEVIGACRSLPPERIPGVEYLLIDLSAEWKRGVLPKRLDSIAHLAQSSQYKSIPQGASDVIQVNSVATARLLQACEPAGAQSFVYASSGSVYGPTDTLISEDSPTKLSTAMDIYAASKIAGEAICKAYSTNLAVTVLRPFFVYGPSQSKSMLIPKIGNMVHTGGPIELQGPSGLEFNPIHVKDASLATLKAIGLESSNVINLSGPSLITIRGLAGLFAKQMGKTPNFVHREGINPRLVASTLQQAQLLSAPKVRIEEGISDFGLTWAK